MIIFIVISCLFSLSMANDVPKKSKIELDPINEASMHDGSERIPFYMILYDCMLQDCSPLIRDDGYLVYPSLKTEKDVLAKMKNINGGVLPLSKQAKEDVANVLTEKFARQKFAENYFQIFAEHYEIHPVSVAKTLHIVAEKYQIKESMQKKVSWNTPATDRQRPRELPKKTFSDLEKIIQQSSVDNESLVPRDAAEEK